MTIPYFGTWKIVDDDGKVLAILPSQDQAMMFAQDKLKAGEIISIDATRCQIEMINAASEKARKKLEAKRLLDEAESSTKQSTQTGQKGSKNTGH